MIRAHVLLTLMVGAGAAAVVWKFRPQVWTDMQTAGICLLAVGFVCWTIARFQLGASFAVKAEARRLVTRGFYAKIRNPIYAFGSLVIAGAILVRGKPLLLLIFLVLIPLQLWRARKESSVLEAAYGEEYRKYRAGTWF